MLIGKLTNPVGMLISSSVNSIPSMIGQRRRKGDPMGGANSGKPNRVEWV